MMSKQAPEPTAQPVGLLRTYLGSLLGGPIGGLLGFAAGIPLAFAYEPSVDDCEPDALFTLFCNPPDSFIDFGGLFFFSTPLLLIGFGFGAGWLSWFLLDRVDYRRAERTCLYLALLFPAWFVIFNIVQNAPGVRGVETRGPFASAAYLLALVGLPIVIPAVARIGALKLGPNARESEAAGR